jgi:hypothetical protein
MTKSDFMRVINQIERSVPVGDWRIAGVPVWPMIRFEVYATNFNPTFAEKGLAGGWHAKLQTVGQRLGSWAWTSLWDRHSTTPAVAKADVVFLAYSIGTPPLVDGRRYKPLLAPYVDLLGSLGQQSLVWESAPSGRYNIPRYTPSALIEPGLVLSRGLNSARRSFQVPVHLPGYDDLLALLAAEDLRTRYADLFWLRRDAVFVWTLSERFLRWLRQVRPRLGIVADASLRDEAFILACRRLGITTVELQHGVQGDLHPNYGSWEAVPVDGYATKPDIFWCWDQESADAINRWAACANGAHRAIVGGDPWRQLWLEGRNALVDLVDGQIAGVMERAGARRHMLITLDTVGELIPSEVLQMMREAPASWCFWLRVHPVDGVARLRALERILNNERFRWMPPRWVAELPLHGILRQVDLHLTVSWSSVILEASAFGVRSIACSPEAKEVYPSELEKGMLQVAATTGEMLALMERLFREQRVPRSSGHQGDCLQVMRELLSTGDRAARRAAVGTGPP